MRNIPFSPPDITEAEIEAVAEVMRSGWITTGPKTKQFEGEIAAYCGNSKAACVASCTAAMEMALRLCEVGEGDEVITSAYTYTATAAAALHVGAKVVLCDIADGSFEMDYQKLEALITEKTKAIMAVDIAGVICDYDRIFDIVDRHRDKFSPRGELQEKFGRIIVIADGAHSFGSQKGGKRAGSFADFTAFSFHAVKNLTTAEGGALTWRDRDFLDSEEIYRQAMLLCLHGQSKDALAKTKLGAWEYDVVAPLYKCNMTDITAAIGLSQLERYDDILARRQAVVDVYNTALSDSRFIKPALSGENFASNNHLYLLRIQGYDSEKRCALIEKMAQCGVACNVHYKPLPMLTAYKNLGFSISDFPIAQKTFENEITLPVNSKMTVDDASYVADILNKEI